MGVSWGTVLCSGMKLSFVRHMLMFCEFLLKFTSYCSCQGMLPNFKGKEREILKNLKAHCSELSYGVICWRAEQPGALSPATHLLPGQGSGGFCRLSGQILDAFEKLVID